MLDRELVSPETLVRARSVQAETGERLDAVLTRLGDDLRSLRWRRRLSGATGFRLVTSDDFPAEPVAAATLAPRVPCAMRSARSTLRQTSERGIEIAFVDPLDSYVTKALAFALDSKVTPVVARTSDVEAALDRLYGAPNQPQEDGWRVRRTITTPMSSASRISPATRPSYARSTA